MIYLLCDLMQHQVHINKENSMNISILVNSFLAYLQHNNAKLGNNRYQSAWLDNQAYDFKQAMNYAEQRAPEVLNSVSGEGLADFIKTIHQQCASETYRIAIHAVNGDAIKHERVGVFRTTESFAMKSVPLIDINHSQDKVFLSTGNMPRLMDGRLQLMGHHPQHMTLKDKLTAMHGQPAWLEANNVLQISAYIHAHHGAMANYYFLCGYYREHFIKNTRLLTERDKAFAHFMENEINTLGKTLQLKFNKVSTTLTREEEQANALVYTNYVLPEKIPAAFANFAMVLANDVHALDVNTPQKIAEFCFNHLQEYIRIHPFLDANYRTFAIFINTVLAHAGYEYIDFHDAAIKVTLNVQFGENEPNKVAATQVLSAALKRITIGATSNSAPSSVSIFNKIEPGKAIRTTEANEKALRNAANAGDLDAVKRLIHIGTDIDAFGPETGKTALHRATQQKHTLVVALLIESGADINLLDKNNKRAIDYAEGHEYLINLFTVHDATKTCKKF